MDPTTLVLLAEDGADEIVAGLSSLDRIVMTALAAGLTQITILTSRPELARRLLRPQAWNRATIALVTPGSKEARTALEAIAEEGRTFVLAHAALALTPRSLPRLMASGRDHDGATLATVADGPSRAHPLAFPVKNGAGPEGLVCPGLALLPSQAALWLAGSAQEIALHLRSALSELVQTGQARTLAVEPDSVVLLATARDRRRAAAALMRSAGKESDGLVARHINRRVSGALTRLLLPTSVTPNALTAVTLALGIGAGWALVQGTHGGFLLGTLLYQINSTIDGCDGEIARLKFLASRFGEWADSISDQVGNLTFVLTAPIGLVRMHPGQPVYRWLGAFVLVSLLVLLPVIYVRSRRVTDAAHMNDFGRSLVRGLAPGSWRQRLLAALVVVARRDFYALLFFVLALVGLEEAILVLLTVGAAGHFPALLLRPTAAAAS